MFAAHHRKRTLLGLTAGISLAGGSDALAAPFTTSYTDGGNWNTVYAQGFSPSLTPNPDPALAAGDPVLLDQFQFFKSGNADSAADVRLVILDNIFTNLQGLTLSSGSVVGISSNTVASTAPIATGAPITFDFDNLQLTYGNSYGAVFVNVGTGGELTPVLVSALTANYVEASPGDWHPQTNYGTETQYQYSVSNFITTNEFGQFFNAFSYAGDANFVASLMTPSVVSTWNATGSGNWNVAGNWLGAVPNAVGASAMFSAAATSAAAVSADVNISLGTITLDNAANSYTIAGPNTVTMDVSSGSASINVTSGSHAITAPLVLADNTTLSVAPAASVLTIANLAPAAAVTVSKTGAGTAVVNNVRAAGVAVSGGVLKIAPNAGAAGVSNVGSLSITGAARLDLTNNKLITTTPTGSATAGVYNGVQGEVQRASNGGAWDQPGLTTSQADAVNGLTSIGVATGEQILGLGPSDTALFAGQTITGASTVAMYTYAGDANLDGFISGDDYASIDGNVGVPGASGWYNGDFNYDGIVSGDDYAFIDSNIVAQGAPFPTGSSLIGVAAVPEPASSLGVAVLAWSVVGRRRRRSA